MIVCWEAVIVMAITLGIWQANSPRMRVKPADGLAVFG